jgi:Peptidase family M48
MKVVVFYVCRVSDSAAMRLPRRKLAMRSLRWVFPVVLAAAPLLRAQECKMPTAPAHSDANMFTPEQSVQLGNLITQQLGGELLVVNNDALTAGLQRIGDRLVQQVSPDVPVHFFLSELPVANAFTFPGGRVYVTRKLVALTRSEDELAAVLAHELGHVAAHDPEISLSHKFQKVLGVTQLGPNSDLPQLYNRLLSNFARDPSASKRERDQKTQLSADQLGVFALAGAGYSPDAFAQFWDRMSENKSATGNWFSNLFGATRPEALRFREALKNAAALPPGCVHKLPSDAKRFESWREEVIKAETVVATEKLRHVVRKVKLDPPLRPDLFRIKFSNDGNWLLAQDETSIYVISREPLAFKSRIDAPEAEAAQFTPDSRSLVFHNRALRVEEWELARQRQTFAQEISVPSGCMQSELAPDGKTLACVDRELSLRLIEVATGETVFQRKRFYTFNFYDEMLVLWTAALQRFGLADEGSLRLFQMVFTPDAHYFIVARGNMHLAVDVVQHANLPLNGGIARLLAGGFTFYGTQRLLGINALDPRKSAMARFPSGETLATYAISPRELQAPAHGDHYVIVRPAGDYAAGALDLAKQQIVIANKTPAFDMYDDIFAAERKGGDLELYRMPSKEALGRVTLPDAPLGRLRAINLTPDFGMLRSQRLRAAVFGICRQASGFST